MKRLISLIVLLLLSYAGCAFCKDCESVEEADRRIASIKNQFVESNNYMSMACLRQAIKMYECHYGTDHEKVLAAKMYLAKYFMKYHINDRAIAVLNECIGISKNLYGADSVQHSLCLLESGINYLQFGAEHLASPLIDESIAIMERRLDKEDAGLAFAMAMKGVALGIKGDFSRAINLLENSYCKIQSKKGTSDPRCKKIAESLCVIYMRNENYRDAGTWLQRTDNPFLKVSYDFLTGKTSEAYSRFLGVGRPDKDELQYYVMEGVILNRNRRTYESTECLLKAVESIEGVRSSNIGVLSNFFQASIDGIRYVEVYKSLVESLIANKYTNSTIMTYIAKSGSNTAESAFYYSEALKARVLLDKVTASSIEYLHSELPHDLLAKEGKIKYELTQLNVAWENVGCYKYEAIKAMLEKRESKLAEFKQFVLSLRKSHPQYAALHYPQPATVSSLKLNKDEILIEYFLGEQFGAAFVIDGSGKFQVIKIPIARASLKKKVASLMSYFESRPGVNVSFPAEKSHELYNLLLKGVVKCIKQNKIIIIPDGILGALPFEVLVQSVVGGRVNYFGDKWSIRYYQSAALLNLERSLSHKKQEKIFFAVGNPIFSKLDPRYLKKSSLTGHDCSYRGKPSSLKDTEEIVYPPLPETETEINNICKILDVKNVYPDILIGVNATEEQLYRSKLDSYKYLHFATHADLPGAVEGVNEPFILLNQVDNSVNHDGLLTMNKVLKLKLNADLVVLSACHTGQGHVLEGEGVANFARAFQSAGARSVLISLWGVESNSTVDLMKFFYKHLKEGKSRSDALRLARIDMREINDDPFYWAPFILHGAN